MKQADLDLEAGQYSLETTKESISLSILNAFLQVLYAEEQVKNEFFFLKSEYKIKRINFNDIQYIEGMKDYIKVFTTSESKPVLSLTSLKILETKLPAGKFMRVHRSFIVNLEKINTIERSRIVFGTVYIPVSDQYKEKFQKFLDINFI
jgi:two-component system response regulator LytT